MGLHALINPWDNTILYCSGVGCNYCFTSVQGVSCQYFHRVQQKLGSQSQLRTQHGYNTAWDIEDLVKLGRRVKVRHDTLYLY